MTQGINMVYTSGNPESRRKRGNKEWLEQSPYAEPEFLRMQSEWASHHPMKEHEMLDPSEKRKYYKPRRR